MHENRALEPLDRGPYFDISASRNVTALVGKTATLTCRVRNLGDRTVGNLSSIKDASHVVSVRERDYRLSATDRNSIIRGDFSLRNYFRLETLMGSAFQAQVYVFDGVNDDFQREYNAVVFLKERKKRKNRSGIYCIMWRNVQFKFGH